MDWWLQGSACSRRACWKEYDHSVGWLQVVRGLVMARERLQQEGTLEGKLKALAKAATEKGRAFFTLPEGGCCSWQHLLLDHRRTVW